MRVNLIAVGRRKQYDWRNGMARERSGITLSTLVQIGNLVQVVAVVLGVGFSLWEFVLKDRDFIRLQRETTIRLVLNEGLKEEESRAFHYLSQHLHCKSPDVDSKFKWGCTEFSKPPENLSDWRAMQKITGPVHKRLSRIAVCIKSGLCDADLTKNLVCFEVRTLKNVNNRLYAETKVASGVGVPLSELIHACEDSRFIHMW
jgi:hypothetical protein